MRPNTQKSTIHPSSYVKAAQPNTPIVPIPITHQFSDFAMLPELKQNVKNKGYETPTPIQDQTIPLILENKDVIGIANTGTGKTAAFLLPLIHKVVKNRSEKILIIIPTRELAVQIRDEFAAFAKHLNLFSLLCIGGASIDRQIYGLRQGPNFVIGTPGRLKDLINRHFLNLSTYRTIVLDEVDRMVDIGFLPDIKFIVSLLPKPRQSLFFSATVSPEVNTILGAFVKDPVTVRVTVAQTAQNIHQDIVRVRDATEKLEKLQALLKQEENTRVLVFGRTKWGVERLAKTLIHNGFKAASIHGNKSLNQRLNALNQFKQGLLQTLIATDVAARGIDIEDVSLVINYDEPSTYTDYVHRIGRTGRAQKAGKALTFVH
jgi:superfamily II DNA/RNA helicase